MHSLRSVGDLHRGAAMDPVYFQGKSVPPRVSLW